MSGAVERLTVGFIRKAADDLHTLVRMTGMNKADVINRAVSVYAFIELERSIGRELLIRDPDTGDVEKVSFR